MRALVIVNRRARRLATSGPVLDELRRPRPGVEVRETWSLADLDDALHALPLHSRDAQRGPTAIVLAGGDGSHMAGVSAIARACGGALFPPIAFAPGGTVGTIARNWGAKGSPARRAARLLDGIVEGTVRTTRRPTLRILEHDMAGHVRRERVGFIFGAGLVARFFELYEARGAGGNLAAARIVGHVFAGSFVGGRVARLVLTPRPCAVTIDGTEAPFDRISLLCASVVRDLGLGMKLMYRAGERADRFHVVATPLEPKALGPQMPLVLAGRPLFGPGVDAMANSVCLRFPYGRGAYVLDGDLFRADAITVSVGPILDALELARSRVDAPFLS